MKTRFYFYISLFFIVVEVYAQTDTIPPWYFTNTGRNHIISIPVDIQITIGNDPIEAGDYIGVFYDSTGTGTLACGGYVRWNGEDNVPMVAWGDDDINNNPRNGFYPNEIIRWKIWKRSDQMAYDAVASYVDSLPHDSLWVNNGQSRLRSLVADSKDLPPWWVDETDYYHDIRIPDDVYIDIEDDTLVVGDYIGVFYDSSGVFACAGYTLWAGITEELRAYGDDPDTPDQDGLADEEVFKWKIWKQRDSTEFFVLAEYDTLVYPNDSLFVDRGSSKVLSFYTAIPDTSDTTDPGEEPYDSSLISIHKVIKFGDIQETKNYKMVGIPGDSAITLESRFFRGRPIEDWIAFADLGDQLFLPFNTTTKDEFVFRPGKAFWILSKFPLRITTQLGDSLRISPVKLNEGEAYSIQLNEGWNLISNPFNKIIDWVDVQRFNGIADNIYNFINGAYPDRVGLFEPFLGYYFYNRLDLDSLMIPFYDVAIDVGKSLHKNNGADKELVVQAFTKSADTTMVRAVLSPHANMTLDDLDQFSPPSYFQDLQVSFVNTSLETDYKLLKTEARPYAEGNMYSLSIVSNYNESVTLQFDGMDNFMGEHIFFYDPGIKKYYDVSENNEITIQHPTKDAHYKVLLGSTEFISEQLDYLVIDGFELHQNFPNPFNPTTTIHYTLSERSRVSVSIYNTLGEVIHTKSFGELSQGYHSYVWNAGNNPNGIYFCSVTVQSQERSKTYRDVVKMILLK